MRGRKPGTGTGRPLILLSGEAAPGLLRRSSVKNLKVVPDFGAPLAVVAVDLIAESYAPTWTKWIDGIMTAGGYVLGGWLGWGGDFVKNMGIASMPITARNIYDYVRGGEGSTQRRLQFRPVSSPRVAQQVSKIPVEPFGKNQGLF
jgi:hypothetical protein